MIEVKKLERDQWKNYELKFSYDTDGYYSFKVYDWDFQLIFHPVSYTHLEILADILYPEE